VAAVSAQLTKYTKYTDIPYIATLDGFKAATAAVVKTAKESFVVKLLQEYEVI
jgi:hypothetical protein